MEDRHLPSSRNPVHVNTQGAVIVDEDADLPAIDHSSGGPSTASSRDSHDIYLPAHTEWISHVAIDIGGSLAKVVYFSRAAKGKGKARDDQSEATGPNGVYGSRPASPGRTTPVPNGVLGPESIASAASIKSYFESNPAGSLTKAKKQERPATHRSNSITGRLPHHNRRRSSFTFANGEDSNSIPGGWLNFTKFETGDIAHCIEFINMLIEASSASHGIPCTEFKAKHVKIMATGGGAHLLYERLSEELGVEVRKEEEMQCLIAGLTFFMEIPHEVFWYSDELVHSISHPPPIPINGNDDLPRPSPNPPQYSLVFDENPTPQFPCMLVNIGSGVSIIKVDEYGKFERISGTSLGGGTLWGLLSMLTGAESFDEMLELSEKGDNSTVDMLVGDIYGSDYSKIGLKSSTIASSFGKVWRKGNKGKQFKPEDIAKSLLYAISNNIGQIAYMNAEKHNLDHIYFGGCFIRGHAATISTLSYAIRFWSKGTKKALFLRHEGYLGAIGAWLRNIEEEDVRR